MVEDKELFASLIKDMDVPEFRRTDYHWLSRNLFVRNSEHPNFKQAIEVLKKILKKL